MANGTSEAGLTVESKVYNTAGTLLDDRTSATMTLASQHVALGRLLGGGQLQRQLLDALGERLDRVFGAGRVVLGDARRQSRPLRRRRLRGGFLLMLR